MKFCHSCGEKQEIEGKVGREDTCPHCGAHLHVCLNCEFYDEHAHNRCREPEAEWVSDREKSNFCEFFRYRESSRASANTDRKKKAKEELRRLFGED